MLHSIRTRVEDKNSDLDVRSNPLSDISANAAPPEKLNAHLYSQDHVYDLGLLNSPAQAPEISPTESARQLQQFKERLITLPLNAVTISKTRLGSGAFGSVFVGEYQGQPVAVKEFNPQGVELEAAEALQAFEWETSRLSTLHHPNLVRFYGVYQNAAGRLCMVMELCDKRDLSKRLQAPELEQGAKGSEPHPYDPIEAAPAVQSEPHGYDAVEQSEEAAVRLSDAHLYNDEPAQPEDKIKAHDQRYVQHPEQGPTVATSPRAFPGLPIPSVPPLGWSTIWRIALDLAHGLAYLHEQGTLHRDLKSENVLFDLNGRAKLADLGVAQVDAFVQTEEAKIISKNLKDYSYAAPEEFQRITTAKSDMFSYGLVLCEMLQGKTLGDVYRRKSGKLETIPESCPEPLRTLIEQCWHADPEQRPAARQVIGLLEACKHLFTVSESDSLLPRLETELEYQHEALLQYLPSRINERESIQDALNAFLSDDKTPVLAVLGEGGLGKSLCTYYLANELLQANRRNAQSYAIAERSPASGLPNVASLDNASSSSSSQPNSAAPWLPIFIRPGIAQWRHDALRDGATQALRYYGLTPQEIERLRTQTIQQLVLILDGYDELSGDALGNLPTTLGLPDWPHAKLIISSRPSVASPDQLPNLFGLQGICVVHTLLPFDQRQFLAFLHRNLHWDEQQQQQFEAVLSHAPELARALQNPFVLHLFAQSWDTQKTQNLKILKTHEIYENFIRHWLTTYAPLLPPPLQASLLGQALDPNQQPTFNPLAALRCAQDWLSRTAFTMAKGQTLSVPLESMTSAWTQIPEALNTYARDLFQKRQRPIDALTQTLATTEDPAKRAVLTKALKALQRRALMTLTQYQTLLLTRAQQFLDKAPLKRRNAEYQFIHKSLWEYAVAQGIRDALSHPIDQPTLALASGLTPHFMLQDASVLQFLQALSTPGDFQHWEDWLHASKASVDVAPVAACAITALNGLQRGLSDLRGIRVPQADLRNAWLNNSDCREADFTGALLNNSCLIGAQFQNARLNDIQLGQFPTLQFDDVINAMVYHPTEPLIAVATGKNIILRHPHTQKIIATLEGHASTITSVNFSPDGALLASGSKDNTVRVWDPRTFVLLATLEGHATAVTSVSFRPIHSLLASGSEDHAIHLWDTRDFSLRATLKGHTSHVTSVSFSPDGALLASGSQDKTIRLWDTRDMRLCATLKGHTNNVGSLSFSSDGTLLASGSDDKTVCLWDTRAMRLRATLKSHTDRITSVSFSRNGALLASGSWDNIIHLWDPRAMRLRATITGHTNWISSVSFSPDGTLLASGSYDATVRLWDPRTFVLRATLTGYTGLVTSVSFSADGALLASGNRNSTVRLWDPYAMSLRATLSGHTEEVNSLSFNRDGTLLASGSDDKTVRLWDPRTFVPRATLNGHTDRITSVSFSGNGALLASGSRDETVCLWDPHAMRLRATLKGHTNWISGVSFSSDGALLASGSYDKTIRLWDSGAFALHTTLKGHTDYVTSVSFSPDDALLASGSKDKTVRLWDLRSFACTHTLKVPSAIEFLTFSGSGKQLSIAFGTGFQVYDLTASKEVPYPLSGSVMTSGALSAQDCDLTNAVGLTENQQMVLTQLGAKGQPKQEQEPLTPLYALQGQRAGVQENLPPEQQEFTEKKRSISQ